jgi:hypothetical protein
VLTVTMGDGKLIRHITYIYVTVEA